MSSPLHETERSTTERSGSTTSKVASLALFAEEHSHTESSGSTVAVMV